MLQIVKYEDYEKKQMPITYYLRIHVFTSLRSNRAMMKSYSRLNLLVVKVAAHVCVPYARKYAKQEYELTEYAHL